jgi:hypothetical protein
MSTTHKNNHPNNNPFIQKHQIRVAPRVRGRKFTALSIMEKYFFNNPFNAHNNKIVLELLNHIKQNTIMLIQEIGRPRI